MTQIPELLFTPENLQRKLDTPHYPKYLFTTRDEVKGEKGDVFFVRGIGYYVLMQVINSKTVKHFYENFYWQEGFSSPSEFRDELYALYPHTVLPYGKHPYYLHILRKLNGIDHIPQKTEDEAIDLVDVHVLFDRGATDKMETYEARLPLNLVTQIIFIHNPTENLHAVKIVMGGESAYLIRPTKNAATVEAMYDLIVKNDYQNER